MIYKASRLQLENRIFKRPIPAAEDKQTGGYLFPE